MKKLNKYIIVARVVVVAKNIDSAKEDFLKQLARTENHHLADSLVEIYDEDTRIVRVEDGIFTANKIKLTGYDGIKIETAVGEKVLTKYGDTFTIKSWNAEHKTLQFEENEHVLHESRISFG